MANEDEEAGAIYARVVRGDRGPRIPLATYRVQLNEDFTFGDASAIVDYLDALGISDLYSSPFFAARPGSRHGYDLVDHNALSSEIGPREALLALHNRLEERQMGLLLDFVPNHMGVGTSGNRWWTDVLENGPSSLHAPFFDIDWAPLKSELEGKVLLPVLGDHYGRVLENGDLAVVYDGGAFFVQCYQTLLPVNPTTYPLILQPVVVSLVQAVGDEHDAVLELMSIITGLSHLPRRTETRRPRAVERRREKEVLKRRLASLVAETPVVAETLQARVVVLNGERGVPRSFDALHQLLEEQAYRFGYWRVAAEEINYRRFFDYNDLAAIRMENPAVFSEAHRLLFELVEDGTVTGLRIDHPDGLWDPASYFARLQRVVFLLRCGRELRASDGNDSARCGAPSSRVSLPPAAAAIEGSLMRRFDQETATREGEPPPRPLYVVVEKILARGEELPRDWAVHGTSGYEFASLVGGLFVDVHAERPMTLAYERFIGRTIDFATLIYEKKKLILEASMASELNVLAHALNRLSERDRHTRDFTLGLLTIALREVIACFPVYRTYIREQTAAVAPRDRAAIGVAIRLARRRNPSTDVSVYAFLRAILLLDVPATVAEEDRDSFRAFVMKFQQLTGPVMAKGLEDTAFYVYTRLVSLNEVGGEPERFGVGLREFHLANEERQRSFPHSMLATSTHDTKRGEDVRARISVLSELPAEWEAALHRFAEATAPLKADLEGQRAPDANEEVLFYQTVLGTWPSGAEVASKEYVERLVVYMRKATKEAKVNTSWINAEPEYDAAVEAFVRGALKSEGFRAALLPLARAVAFHGRWGALSQILLKLTSPGVPDLYQGTELWDDSLVDPDNRRPVDYVARRRVLAAIVAGRDAGAGFARGLVASAEDGRVKLFVTHVALMLRRAAPELFGANGAYLPLAPVGPRREHLVAFVRSAVASGSGGANRELVVIAPRLTAKLVGARLAPPTGDVWAETSLPAPAGRYTNLFTGETISTRGTGPSAVLRVDEALRDFPLALLSR